MFQIYVRISVVLMFQIYVRISVVLMFQIYVRTGVTRDCPEGVDWIHQNTDTLGAVNIAVGPTGLVWTVTWDGLALVRLGVNSEHVYGNCFHSFFINIFLLGFV